MGLGFSSRPVLVPIGDRAPEPHALAPHVVQRGDPYWPSSLAPWNSTLNTTLDFRVLFTRGHGGNRSMKTPAMRTSGCIGEIQDCIISCLNVVSNSTVACMRTFVAPIARHTHALNYHELTPGQLAEKAMVGGVHQNASANWGTFAVEFIQGHDFLCISVRLLWNNCVRM